MVTITIDTWSLIIGIILGIFCCYTYVKLSMIQHRLDTLPTPLDLAKEIVNIKLPISELPQDVQDRLAQMNGQQQPLPQNKLTPERPNYLG